MIKTNQMAAVVDANQRVEAAWDFAARNGNTPATVAVARNIERNAAKVAADWERARKATAWTRA